MIAQTQHHLVTTFMCHTLAMVSVCRHD